MKRNYTSMRTTAFLLMTLVATDVSAQQKPTTGYAPVNGLNMYYEVHGGGEPVVKATTRGRSCFGIAISGIGLPNEPRFSWGHQPAPSQFNASTAATRRPRLHRRPEPPAGPSAASGG